MNFNCRYFWKETLQITWSKEVKKDERLNEFCILNWWTPGSHSYIKSPKMAYFGILCSVVYVYSIKSPGKYLIMYFHTAHNSATMLWERWGSEASVLIPIKMN